MGRSSGIFLTVSFSAPTSPLPAPTRLAPFRSFLLGLVVYLCLQIASANQQIPAAPAGLVESGAPAFVFFSPETIGLETTPTDLKELPDGRILLVAQREFALSDGVRWEVYHRSVDQHGQTLSSVAIGPDNTIFCGIKDGFARVDFNSDGRWHLTRVSTLSASAPNTSPVFSSSHLLEDHWYWHGDSGAIVRWDLKGLATALLKVDAIEQVFTFKNNLYISDSSKGFVYCLQDHAYSSSPSLIPLSKGMLITANAKHSEQQLLVGTISEGLFLFDGAKLARFVSSGVLSGGRRINDLCQTQGGYYAAAVDTYGIVFFDSNGRIIQILDRKVDQRLARVKRLHKSQDGVIWGLCNEGVVRIEFPSRLSHFEQLLDTAISHVEPIRFQGKLWFLATGRILRGIYNDNGRLLELIDDSPQNVYTFTVRQAGNRLIAGTEQGIFEYTNSAWVLLVPKIQNARILCQDARGLDRWLYCAMGELGWLDFTGRTVQVESLPAPQLTESYNSVQDAAAFVWLELGSGKVGRLDPKSSEIKCEIFDQSNGIPEAWAALYMIDGTVRMNCGSHQLCFNEQAKRWEEDRALLRRYPSLADATGRPVIDSRGRLWVSGNDMVRIVDPTKPDIIETLPGEFHPFNFSCETKGVVWMHDKHRFARYDPDLPQVSVRPVRAVITQIDLAISGRTLINPSEQIPDLESSDNSLIAHFLAPGNPFGQRVSFEIKLDGSLEEWTSTGIIGSAVFNHLKPGAYTLHVRPKIGSAYGAEAVLRFNITPPWYRTPLAYTVTCILSLGIISLLIYLPIRNERQQQSKLKALVAIRTRELKESNEQLRVMVDDTRLKAAALKESEDRYRRLSSELEQRVNERTDELSRRVKEVELLNADLQESHAETARSAAILQEVNANLLVANHELESFSYTVSHDLRAPLRNITGFMELLGKRVRSLQEKESDRYLDIVVSEARRMASLIDDLLTFSRVGRTEMKMQEVHLNDLIMAAQREMGEDFKNRLIEWRIAELPPVLGDKTLLRQVIINLLSNAVKFTRRETSAIIEIGSASLPGNDSMASFYVRDNGVGFNPRYMDKLFRVFQRLHTPRDFEGTGIGLANVKRIITRHGGRIWAEGAVNGGATFHFTLKLNPKPLEPAAATSHETPEKP